MLLTGDDGLKAKIPFNELPVRQKPRREKPDQYNKKAPIRRYSVLRGRVIYVCPVCFERVRQFNDWCLCCGQAIDWDISVK